MNIVTKIYLILIINILQHCYADDLWVTPNKQVMLNKNTICYIYNHTSVIVDSTKVENGAGIFITRHSNNCNWKTHPANSIASYEKSTDMNFYFKGVYNNLILLDEGCCPEIRTIVIYDLARRKQKYKQSYMDNSAPSGTIVKNHKLYFWQINNGNLNQCNHDKLSDANGLHLVTMAQYYLNLRQTKLVAEKAVAEEKCAYTQ
jgi:hypothetical protein